VLEVGEGLVVTALAEKPGRGLFDEDGADAEEADYIVRLGRGDVAGLGAGEWEGEQGRRIARSGVNKERERGIPGMSCTAMGMRKDMAEDLSRVWLIP
jgi:hypothetical protein